MVWACWPARLARRPPARRCSRPRAGWPAPPPRRCGSIGRTCSPPSTDSRCSPIPGPRCVDLERLGSSPPPSGGLASVEGQILAADRGLAAGAIIQALGGPGGLLIRARGMILSGDRWAETSRLDLAAEQYGAGWRDAFHALNELVHVRVAFVSPRALATAALRALGSAPRIRPAGVHVFAGRRALERTGKPDVLFVGYGELSGLRYRALGAGRRAGAVRDVLEPEAGRVRGQRAAVRAVVHVLRREVRESVRRVRPDRALE